MKLSVTIVLLSIASYAFAQSSNKDSRSTKIDEDEKIRLENQYKALNNVYINDEGLVVYQAQGDSVSQNQNVVPTDTTSHKTPLTPSSTKTKETEGNYLVKESEDIKSTPSQKPLSTRIVSSEVTEAEAVPQDKAPVRSSVIRKEALQPTEANNKGVATTNPTEEGKETATKPTTVKNSPITDEDQTDNSSNTTKNTTQSKKDTSKTIQPKLTSTKSSVFDKNKRPSQYKTMEEAALAVEALLEDLRKEQSQATGAGSMSSRLSGGAGRTTLRKRPATNPSYSTSDDSDSTVKTSKSEIISEDDTSQFGSEPTYFINGKEVDKTEVNKLRKKEIISREVRTRNTVSGNPNGEVWYEVKYDAN